MEPNAEAREHYYNYIQKLKVLMQHTTLARLSIFFKRTISKLAFRLLGLSQAAFIVPESQ